MKKSLHNLLFSKGKEISLPLFLFTIMLTTLPFAIIFYLFSDGKVTISNFLNNASLIEHSYFIIYLIVFAFSSLWTLIDQRKTQISLKELTDVLLENHYQQDKQQIELENLIDELEVMKSIIENAPFGIVFSNVHEKDDPIIYINKEFTKMTGYTREDIIGKNCRMLQGNETDKNAVWGIRHAIQNKYPYETEILNYKKDGTPFWNRFLIFPIYNSKGESIYFVGVQTDITQIKHLEEEQKRMSGEILEAQKLESLGVTIAGIAHDLNTPIGVALTSSSFLDKLIGKLETEMNREQINPEKVKQTMHSILKTNNLINSNLEKSAHLVKSFKETTADATRKEWRKININSFLTTLLVSLSPILNRSKVKASISAETHLNLYTEPGALGQIITNLIVNATVHAFKDIDEKTIEVYVEEKEQKILIHIKDNGVGLSPDAINQAFTPFFTTNRNNGSSGLGLFSSKRIAQEILNGNLEYSQNIPSGAIFTITLANDKKEIK